jgi:hypothetical protein
MLILTRLTRLTRLEKNPPHKKLFFFKKVRGFLCRHVNHVNRVKTLAKFAGKERREGCGVVI